MKPAFRPPLKGLRLLGALTLMVMLVALQSGADPSNWVKVRWIADGDTIILQDGRHVRYIGIDAPEVAHDDRPAEPMADTARSINRGLVEGWPLRLVPGREKTDRYGRLLAYVYRRDGLFVNAELIRQGCAHVLYRWPNIDQVALLLSAQRDAMEDGRGIWRFVDKNEHPSRPYLGNRRSRRFHSPDCPMGGRTAEKNRVRLENQWAAFWSGYAPASGCIVFPKK